MMKKLLGLICLSFLINGCDDGDIIVENIDFAEVASSKCGNDDIIYKINGSEALILKIPGTRDTFTNDISPLNTPRIDTIGGDVNFTYRAYNGTVAGNSICDSPAPIAPVPTTEWIATDGIIETTTTAIYASPDTETGQSKVTQYNHYVVMKNLRFRKADGSEQNYPEFIFGVYNTVPLPLNFSFTAALAKVCPSKTTIYNAINQGTEGFFIQNITYDNLFSTASPGVVKTATLSATDNKLIYRSFASSLPAGGNEAYFCSNATSPAALEEWVAVGGTVEVTSTANTPGFFLHTIRLKGVTLKRGNTSFYFGDDYLFGEIILPQ